MSEPSWIITFECRVTEDVSYLSPSVINALAGALLKALAEKKTEVNGGVSIHHTLVGWSLRKERA